MSWNGVSHISPNRYIYRFTGSEYSTIAESSTLDISGSFSLGFLIKPEPLLKSNYILCSKGHPTDPNLGSISVESINGFLKVSLFSGITAYTSTTSIAILNTNKIIYIEIVWNSNLKQLLIYKNAVAQGTVMVGDFTQITTINTNASNFEFGRGTGKQSFIGSLYYSLYLGRPRTPLEILNTYNTVKYSGSYASLGTIAFTSTRPANPNGSILYTMKEDGTEQTLLTNAGANNFNNHFQPSYSPDGNKIALVNYDVNYYTYSVVDSDGSNFLSLTSPLIPNPGTTYISWRNNNKIFIKDNTYYTIGFVNIDASGLGHYASLNPSDYADYSSVNNYIAFVSESGGRNALCKSYLDINDLPISQSVLDYTNGSIVDIRVSPDGLKIAYSKRITNIYNIYTIDSDGGNLTQITFSSTYHNMLATFSPDSTKILYTNSSTGNSQLYIMNTDGTGSRNISNNPYNDYFGTWKA